MTDFMLGERQQKTVASAITLVCAIVLVCFVAACFWFAGWLIQRFSSVLLPLAVGAIIALVLKPYHRWWELRLRGRPVAAVFAVFISVLLPLSIAGAAFTFKAVTEVAAVVEELPGWLDSAQQRIEEKLPVVRSFWQKHQVTDRLKAVVEAHGAAILQGATQVTGFAVGAWTGVFKTVGGLFAWAILPIYVGFFMLGDLIEKKKFEDLLPFLRESTRKDISYLVFEFISILISFFRGQIVIAFIQGLLFGIGFSIIGLNYGFTLGFSLGLMNIIPYLGSMVGLGIALPTAFLQDGGGFLTLFLVIVVFVIVQCIEGYYLTPKIMGNRTGLHPMAIIVAIFFWGSVFGGITGMILAIPLTAFLVVCWRLAKTKYIHEVL